MKILYVAKHNSGDNDDEGAITHALEALGHSVHRVQELPRHRRTPHDLSVTYGEFDFCLFHKWENVDEIKSLSEQVPCVFWYFDLISNRSDPSLWSRMEARRRWYESVIPHCLLGFFTDGDWVEESKSQTTKLRWLMQGADERTLGRGVSRPLIYPNSTPIVFTGAIKHGTRREELIRFLQKRYDSRFSVLGGEGPRGRLHGRQLADFFATSEIVIAPDGPTTDRYWSNRVYLTLGLGGFLLHPRCAGLAEQYAPQELKTYASRTELTDLIDHYLEAAEERRTLRKRGLEATYHRHLYRHRCQELITHVEAAL